MPAANDIESSPDNDQVTTTEVSLSYRAPLPPPAMLAGYEQALPGSADRIVTMAENQAQHRQTLEMAALHSDIQRSHAGLFMGFIVALAFLGGSVFLIASGKQAAGLTIGLTDIAVVVGMFIYGSLSRRDERRRKAELLGQEPYEPLEE